MTVWSGKIGRYTLNVLIAIDQLANALLPCLWGPFAGYPDETISSAIGKLRVKNGGKIPWFHPLPKLIDSALERIDRNHTIDAIEHDEGIPIK